MKTFKEKCRTTDVDGFELIFPSDAKTPINDVEDELCKDYDKVKENNLNEEESEDEVDIEEEEYATKDPVKVATSLQQIYMFYK